jgi:hypothetical protein
MEMTCAVPVLPETSRPSSLARPAVPAPFTASHSPSCSAASVPGRNATRSATAGAGTGFQPLPSSTALITCGVTRVPPLATVEIITASDAGVTATCPWPIDTEMVSPAYHFSPVRRRFHSVEGTMLSCSLGRSMPVFPTMPCFSDHLWILSTPSMLPSV